MTGHSGSEDADIRVDVIALDHFARVLKALNGALDELEAGEVGATGEVRGTAIELRKAVQTVFDERKRVDGLSGQDRRGSEPLDLDAARAALKRKLDRLAERDDEG